MDSLKEAVRKVKESLRIGLEMRHHPNGNFAPYDE